MLNHYEYHRELTTKSGMLKNLTEICEDNGRNIFEFVPLTFIINLSDRNWEYDLYNFMEYFCKNNPKPMSNDKKKIEIKKKNKTIFLDKNFRLGNSFVNI